MEKITKIPPHKWIVLTLVLAALLAVIILPPLFRMALEEEKKPVPEKKELSNEQVVCRIESEKEEVIIISIHTLEHDLNKLKKYGRIIYLDFTNKDEEDFLKEKEDCDNSNNYTKVEGYSYSCIITKNTITKTSKYDLALFRPNNDLELEYTLDQDINEIIEYYDSLGYICE